MTTISDIAKLAGVGKSTVSRYLNGGSVSTTTKQKIEAVIEETGYIPNPFAQSLKVKRKNFIGTIVPRLDSYATSRTLIGIDEELRNLDYQLLISNTSQSIEREIDSLYNLANQKMAGIILLATEITEDHLEAMEKIDVPILVVGQEHPKLHCLIHDDFQAGFEIGNYIGAQGHKSVVYLGVNEKDIAVGKKRKEGFKQGILLYTDRNVEYVETSFLMDDAKNITPEIIRAYQPSALVCATDNIALGTVKAIHELGMKIPTDISVTGFGGYESTEIVHPSLTTIKFHYKTTGQKAAQKITKLISGIKVPRLTTSPVELVCRESVDKIQ